VLELRRWELQTIAYALKLRLQGAKLSTETFLIEVELFKRVLAEIKAVEANEPFDPVPPEEM
jgi:hypothetical protein